MNYESVCETLHMETSDIVRENSSEVVNSEIDQHIHENLNKYYNNQELIGQRLQELEEEWDVERILGLNAATLSLAGILLGLTSSKKWLLLPLVASGFLVQHATKGWCPPLEIIRRLGFRTRKEIDKEKYALKAIRGDFNYLLDVPNAVWDAVER